MDDAKIIHKESNDKSEFESNIWNYIGVAGVWALYGKKEQTSPYRCLNVGKSKDVGREILYDLGCIHYLPVQEAGSKEYINQFGENQGFSSESGWTQEYLYPRLNVYESLVFILVYDKSCVEYERIFAWATKAKYWRNGKPFKTEQDGDYYEKNKCKYLNTNICFYESSTLKDLLQDINNFNISLKT